MGIVLKALANAVPSTQYPSAQIAAIEQAAASLLFRLLDTGAAEYCENTSELFTLYSRYISLGDRQRAHCLNDGLFERGISFLVGPELFAESTTALRGAPDAPAIPPKRKSWSALQQRPLRWLRSSLFRLIRASDVSVCCDPAVQSHAPNPFNSPSPISLRDDIQRIVFTPPHSLIFLNAVILPALSGFPVSVEETFALICFCSWGNASFTQLLVTAIINLLGTTEVDSTPLFTLMNRLFGMNDGLQTVRIRAFVNDPDLDDNGVLHVILRLKSCGSTKKAYLHTKQLVLLSQSFPQVGKVLQSQTLWETVVTWLDTELQTAFKGYRSNAEIDAYTDDSGPVRRTVSTENTIEAAKIILFPSAI